MPNRFDLRASRDPSVGLRAERTRLRGRDVDEASDLMRVAHARARTLLDEAEQEAEEMLEAARAAGRGIVAEAEEDARAVRTEAILQRDKARELLRDAKQLVARTKLGHVPAPVPPKPAGRNGHAGEPIDLNAASAEDLRVAGLSVTQARRVIARRERDGAYESIDQLAELPGMPAALLTMLKQRLLV